MLRTNTVLGLAALAMAIGCDRNEVPDTDIGEREPENDPIMEGPRESPNLNPGVNRNAIEQVTKARCAFEQRCNNFGADEDFTDLADCESKVREEWRDDLNALECSGGVEQDELDECLEEIRNTGCDRPFDNLGRMLACRSSDICVNTPEMR